jgi:3-hydroxyacyl-[acyl-carrier-protein] dehydratase
MRPPRRPAGADGGRLHCVGITDTTPPNEWGSFAPGCRAGSLGCCLKFNLLDKIELLTDQRLVAVKHVTLAEEYLADHFPTFPVLPGVLMLEAATQAAGWLLHHRRQFGCTMAVLKDARNVKYGHFVAPGEFLRMTAEFTRETPGGAAFRVTGTVGEATAIAGKIELAYFNLGEKNPDLAGLDGRLNEHNHYRWSLLAPAGVSI